MNLFQLTEYKSILNLSPKNPHFFDRTLLTLISACKSEKGRKEFGTGKWSRKRKIVTTWGILSFSITYPRRFCMCPVPVLIRSTVQDLGNVIVYLRRLSSLRAGVLWAWQLCSGWSWGRDPRNCYYQLAWTLSSQFLPHGSRREINRIYMRLWVTADFLLQKLLEGRNSFCIRIWYHLHLPYGMTP